MEGGWYHCGHIGGEGVILITPVGIYSDVLLASEVDVYLVFLLEDCDQIVEIGHVRELDTCPVYTSELPTISRV